MGKTYTFKRKDENRLRKVYRYIRRKPKFILMADSDPGLTVGTVDFNNTAGPVSFNFPAEANYSSIPVVTAVSHDSAGNDSANVNIFITSLTTTTVQFSSSAPFTGKVHFHVYSQD